MTHAVSASFVFVVSLFTSRSAGAETLTLDDAVRAAEARSPLVRRAERERGVAAATRVGAGVLLPANPVLTIAAGHRRDTSSSTPPSRGVEVGGRLEQQIEIAGQRGRRLVEAERAVDVGTARLELARLETRARVRAAYVAVLLAQRNLDNTREQETLAASVADTARIRGEAGAGTEIDRSLADVEHGRLTQERIRATLALDGALDHLRTAIGLPRRAALALTTPLDTPPVLTESLDRLLAHAMMRRAELQVIDAGRGQLDAALVRLRRERVPSPTLFFEVLSQQPGQLYLGGGVALPLPLWRRNQGELAMAQASRALLDEERAIFEQQLELEVAAAHRTARGLREAVEQGRTVVLPAAEKNVELVTRGWRAGKLDLFRVVQAAREASEARRRQLELVGALWDATIAVERATGGAL